MAEPTNPSYTGRTLVVVLAMHRSGSSFVTNLLQRMGMSLGPFDLLGTCEHNKYGHFEAVPIYRLDQQLLGQVFGFTEDVPDSPEILRRFCVSGGHWRLDTLPVSEQQLERGSQLVQQLVTSGCVSGFKDPRVPLLWPFWNHVFSGFAGLNIVPVFLLRSPHEIAMSLFMRSKGAIGYYDALDVTAIHYRQMNVILDSWNGEIAVVQFDPQVLMEDLRKLSKICNLAWSDEFLSRSKSRGDPTGSDLHWHCSSSVVGLCCGPIPHKRALALSRWRPFTTPRSVNSTRPRRLPGQRGHSSR